MSRSSAPRSGGMGLAPRFALAMSLALALVTGGAMFTLFSSTRSLVENSVTEARDEAARLSAGLGADPDTDGAVTFSQIGTSATDIGRGNYRAKVKFESGPRAGEEGIAWVTQQGSGKRPVMVAPERAERDPAQTLFGLFAGMAALVILVGAVVAYMVAAQVAKPIEVIADDVRTIARGNLRHRTRTRAGGEVGSLASAVDRMAASLEEAQDAEIELGMREREREVALEVQEALLPKGVPALEGFDIAAAHEAAAEPGGDFHDFVQSADGRLVLLVADVSGAGVPSALIGATARAYLRSALAAGGDLGETLRRVNREVARDVRRGMAVTALVATLDPATGEMLVACAGHKLPLLLLSDGKLRKVHPEGIALGFDKGPVFDRSLQIGRVELEPGDRVVFAGTGAVQVESPDGEELGEGRFFKLVARNAGGSAAAAVEGVLTAFDAFADGEPYPVDVSLVVLARSR